MISSEEVTKHTHRQRKSKLEDFRSGLFRGSAGHLLLGALKDFFHAGDLFVSSLRRHGIVANLRNGALPHLHLWKIQHDRSKVPTSCCVDASSTYGVGKRSCEVVLAVSARSSVICSTERFTISRTVQPCTRFRGMILASTAASVTFTLSETSSSITRS